MPLRHQIQDSDTVEYLAEKYTGSAANWRDIVDYNNLVFPYLSAHSEDRYRVYAEGFIRVTRESSRRSVTIRKNWTFKTKKNVMSATTKTYVVTEDVVLGSGDAEGFVRVRATTPGLQGNAPAGNVTEPGAEFEANGIKLTARNDLPITGGTEGFIRVTGEYIYIPVKNDTSLLRDYDVRFSFDRMKFFYGEDLKLEDDAPVVGANGDLLTVSFLQNVEQAVSRRFSTDAGDILTDFGFGNRISELIGDNSLPFEAKKRLIRLEVIQALSSEDRVDNVSVDRIILVPSELACYVDLSMRVVNDGSNMFMENVKLGGAS